jgi:DNA-binding PadR family transcriptional regulator
MTPNVGHIERTRRLKGAILELVCENHDQQGARYELISLWGVMERLRYDVGRNEVATALQDLKDRGYLTFVQSKDDDTKRVNIDQIQITPKGRDLVNRIEGVEDKAVQLR